MELSLIRIGNQTCAHVPANLPFEFAVKHGFTAFEWFSDQGHAGWCEADSDTGMRLRLRQTALDQNIAFSVHSPWGANPVTTAGTAAIRRSIDFAADVGARIVNFHLFCEPSADEFAAAVVALLDDARKAGVVLTLENTPVTSPDHFNGVFEVLATMPESIGRVGMCLDTGHANLHAKTRNDYIRFVDRLGHHVPIVHWHAHENWGDRDSHLTLVTGPAGRDPTGLRVLLERLLRRGFCGSIILEQWPSPPELLVDAAVGLRQLLAACSCRDIQNVSLPLIS
jgi:sugar phosphate isomerase/epimerase